MLACLEHKHNTLEDPSSFSSIMYVASIFIIIIAFMMKSVCRRHFLSVQKLMTHTIHSDLDTTNTD